MSKIIRYLIAGGIGMTVNLGIFSLLIHVFNLWYVASSALAFASATTVSFLLQKYWTFQNNQKEQIKKQIGLYLIVSFCNLALNTALVYLFVDFFEIPKLAAQIIAALLVAIGSFFAYRIIFKTPPTTEANQL